MSSIISMRCGNGICEHYNKHDKVSGCHKYNDRNDCLISIKKRRKTTDKSKKRII